MANQWFRMYAEFASDPKVQSMAESMQRRLMMIMCLRCGDVLVTLRDDEIAFALRISDDELRATKQLFLSKKFIDAKWNLLNWDKRQYSADSSKERTKRWRDRHRDGDVTFRDGHGDGLEQNRADTEQNIEESPIVPQGGPVAVPTRKPKPQMTAEQRGWFDEWWNIYPRHVAKLEAEKAWGRHVRDKATADAALAGLKAQLPDFASRERDKIPHPATWLNQHRWTDEPEKQKNLPHPYPVGGVPQNVRTVRSWRGEAMSDLFYPEESRV